jgi:uncharacterized protein YgbK (DUF1537 family)
VSVRLGVIADDLTGANDTGVQFARRGARAIVSLDWHHLSRIAPRADVLVLSTDSRSLAPGVAAQRARVAAQALRKAGVDAIYKKIDSTCRGNVGAELDGVLEVFPSPLTILTPAFPAAGRTVSGGILKVDGVSVHLTSFGRDPVAPVRLSDIPTLVRRQSGRPVEQLSLRQLRDRRGAARRLLREWGQQVGGIVVVADAVRPEDLERLARLFQAEGLPRVMAGSAGLAQAVARTLTWKRRRPTHLRAGDHPPLLIVGSPNPVARAQVARMEERQGITIVKAECREILGGGQRFCAELERVADQAHRALAAGRPALLTLRRIRSRVPSRPSTGATLSEFLGRATRCLAQELRLGGLVLCGGDIAVAACRALGADGIALGGEVEPGVPWGYLVGGERPNLPVITKAGGFGTPDVFHAAIRFLRPARSR